MRMNRSVEVGNSVHGEKQLHSLVSVAIYTEQSPSSEHRAADVRWHKNRE